MSREAIADSHGSMPCRPRLSLRRSDNTDELHVVSGLSYRIGRSPENDLVLDTPSSSKFHAILSCDSDSPTWSITDSGSSNGTLLNSVRVFPSRRYPLSDGDRLKFTKSFDKAPEFTVVLHPAEIAPTQTLSEDDNDAIASTDRTGRDSGVSHKRRLEDESRPNLSKIDDYRCVICGELPLAISESGSEDDLDLIQVLPCRHHFHRGCIDMWLKARPTAATCPSCRAHVDRIEPLHLIYQHAALLRQERQYEIGLQQKGTIDQISVADLESVLLDHFKNLRCDGSGPNAFNVGRLSALKSSGSTFINHLSSLMAYPESVLHTIGAVLHGVFKTDAELATLYESKTLPDTVQFVLDQLVNVWIQAALSLPPPIGSSKLAEAQNWRLPPSLDAVITSSLRPWSASSEASDGRSPDPDPVARARFAALLAQNQQSEAASYAAAQGLCALACTTWARLRDVTHLTEGQYVASLSWADCVQVVHILNASQATPNDDAVCRFVRAVLASPRPARIDSDNAADVRSLLVALVRASPKTELRQSLSDCSRFLQSTNVNVDFMFGVLEQLSTINPMASAFLACDAASRVLPLIHNRDLSVVSLCWANAPSGDHQDLPGINRLLQLMVVTVASHGDLRRQEVLGDLLIEARLPTSSVMPLVLALAKIGLRGHFLIWRLLQQVDLSEFAPNQVSRISNIVHQMQSAGSVSSSASTFFLALFKRHPSRSNFLCISDDSLRADALRWLKERSPSEFNLDSISLLIDHADSDEMIGAIIDDCVLQNGFVLAREPRFYCHLIANQHLQSWLIAAQSASRTKIWTICGQLMAETVVVADTDPRSGLVKVVDDAPEVVSARIYESACRAAIDLYVSGQVKSRGKRNLIRSWIQRFRSLCLVAEDKSRWTGFQNSSMRKLKSSDCFHRELKTAGLYSAVI